MKDKSKQSLKMGLLGKMCQPFTSFCAMFNGVVIYLFKCGFGLVVFLRASGSASWGAYDVLNAVYAHVAGDEDATSNRLGIIFSCIGIGCFVGPLGANLVTASDCPSTQQVVCISGFVFILFGWLGFSQAYSFLSICIYSAIRSTGASIIFMNSSYILQQITPPEMLGRVLAMEFTMEVLAESTVAFWSGRFMDMGVSKYTIAFTMAVVSATSLFFWSTYHMFGLGAAQKRFNQTAEVQEKEKSDFDTASTCSSVVCE